MPLGSAKNLLPASRASRRPRASRVLGRSLRGLHARGGVSFLPLGNLLTSLGVGLVPLALLYVTEAVYAHALSLPALPSGSLLSDCSNSLLLKSHSLSCDQAAPGRSLGSCCAPRNREP